MAYEDMRVYLANLGKYNEGYLVGDWFSFPIDEEDVAERIGLNEHYEEYAVHDTDNFPCEVGEYMSIEELNDLYEMIQDFPEEVLDKLDDFKSYFGSIEELAENLDRIVCYSGCETMTDVAIHFAFELNTLGAIPPIIGHYFDCEAYAEDLEIEGYFIETSYGMCEIK